jgi:hypothetical protein
MHPKKQVEVDQRYLCETRKAVLKRLKEKVENLGIDVSIIHDYSRDTLSDLKSTILVVS